MSPSLLQLLLGLGPACTGDPTAPGVESPAPGSDSELQVSEYDPEVPEYDREVDIDQAAAAVQNAVDNMRVITAHDTLAAYAEVWSLRTDLCPKSAVGEDEWGTIEYWDGACRTPEAVWYNGPMTRWSFEDVNIAEGFRQIFGFHFEADGYEWTGVGMQGQTDVFDEDLSFDYNCSCTGLVATGKNEDGSTSFRTMINGPTHYDKPEQAPSWMDEGIHSETHVTYYLDETGNEVRVESVGSYTLMHDRYDTVAFRIKATFDRSQGTCTALTAGGISVRDSVTGYVAEGVMDAAGACTWCVGSGDLEGLCVDGSELFRWGDSPW